MNFVNRLPDGDEGTLPQGVSRRGPPLAAVQALFPAEWHSCIFLVGGSVRDSLLHLPIKDLDLLAAVSEEIDRKSVV